MTIWRRSAISILSVVSVLALWQLAGTLRWVDPLLLPAPSEVLQTAVFLAANGYQQVPLWQHIFVSVARALAAFFVAVLVGIPLGLLMGLNASLDAALDPFIQFLRPLPKIALIPLTVVWFGIGETSKFFLIFIACFLSVVVGASAAVLNVQRDRIRAAKLLGADRWQIFRFVIIPHTLPELFTSVRLSIGIGWTALIAAELVAATAGLGWMVLNAGNYLRTDIVILGILLLGIIGYALDLMLVVAQKHFVPWAGKDA